MEMREDRHKQTRIRATAVTPIAATPGKHLGLAFPLSNSDQLKPLQQFPPIIHDDNWPINYDFVHAHLGSLMEELMPELIQTFFEDGLFRLVQLQTSVRSSDWQQIWKTAHSLKGSSATLGMLGLSNLCLRLESAAKYQDWDVIYPLATQLHTEFMQIQLSLTTP
ncbi:MAG: Hpt domain-containing protein [Chloroflexi bacterium]|nr:Hpt domain-containing protein [Chloroflexota bacterium]